MCKRRVIDEEQLLEENMKENNSENKQASQGIRLPKVMPAIIIAMFVAGLVISLHFTYAHKTKLPETHVVLSATPIRLPAANIGHSMGFIAHVETNQPSSNVAPETEAALAQFGLSATNLVGISVVAQARSPVILQNPLLKSQ